MTHVYTLMFVRYFFPSNRSRCSCSRSSNKHNRAAEHRLPPWTHRMMSGVSPTGFSLRSRWKKWSLLEGSLSLLAFEWVLMIGVAWRGRYRSSEVSQTLGLKDVCSRNTRWIPEKEQIMTKKEVWIDTKNISVHYSLLNSFGRGFLMRSSKG